MMLKRNNMTRLFLAALFGVSALLTTPDAAFARERKHDIKTLSLEKGVYHDEKIPLAPNNFEPGGEYKKNVKVQYNSRTKTLRFYPKKVGVSTLFINDPHSKDIVYEFRINVKKTNLFNVAREIRSLLRDIEGIQIKTINNKVIVDGQILLPKDMNRIHSVVKQYGESASSLVTLSPLAQTKIAQFIEREINNPEIQVKAVNGKFILQGVAKDKNERDRAEIIAKTYVPDSVIDEAVADKKVLERKTDIVINLIQIKEAQAPPPKKIIQLVVHYVELQKDYNRGFRFQWTPDIGDGSEIDFSTGGRSPGGIVTTITGTIKNLLPKLNWAKEHGHARVLQSSSLIVQDGIEGTLNSTSKIPYQTMSDKALPITQFETVGIRTSVTPSIIGARSDSVSLNMNFSIASLIGQTNNGPMTSQREIKTSVVVRSGQSAAVGGLITNDSGTAYNKMPANTSRNPLISLYASKTFRRSQSQFVVFVTPVIKSSASAGADKIKRKFRLKE